MRHDLQGASLLKVLLCFRCALWADLPYHSMACTPHTAHVYFDVFDNNSRRTLSKRYEGLAGKKQRIKLPGLPANHNPDVRILIFYERRVVEVYCTTCVMLSLFFNWKQAFLLQLFFFPFRPVLF